MSQEQHRYTRRSCFQEFTTAIPMTEGAVQFGEKVSCSKCGNIGANWVGNA